MSPRSSHHWIRRSIAEALRTQDYYVVDTLIGGYDSIENKAFLGSVDYLGNGIADQVSFNLRLVSLNYIRDSSYCWKAHLLLNKL